MLVTLSGIVMLSNAVQLKNAEFPMPVTLSGIVTLVSLLQLLKTFPPMLVTSFPSKSLLGITTSTALLFSLNPLNAPLLMSASLSSHSPSELVLYSTLPFGATTPPPLAHSMQHQLQGFRYLVCSKKSWLYNPPLLCYGSVVAPGCIGSREIQFSPPSSPGLSSS